MVAPQPRIGQVIVCNRKSAVENVGKLNIKAKGIAVNSTLPGTIANQFCFETGCFIYHLNVLWVESFKL